jgi:tetratricopeptide (TPR) repeat protein
MKAHPVRAMLAVLLLAAGLGAGCAHLWAAYQYAQGNRLVGRQEYAEAYPHYANSLKIWHWSAETHLIAGRTARRAAMIAEAEDHFERCLSLSGRDSARSAAVALERLMIQAQDGDLADIEQVLWGRVKQQNAETQLILEALARGYARTFRLADALKCIEIVLKHDPDNVEALSNRAWVAERLQDTMDPLPDFRRALQLRPDRDDIRLSFAHYLLKADPNEAIRQYEQLLARQPDNPDIVLGLVKAYQRADHRDGAEKAAALVDLLLQKDPDNPGALTEKGSMLVAIGDFKGAEALLRRALANDPSQPEIQFHLYLCLRQQPGREGEASDQRRIFDRVWADRNRLAEIIKNELSKRPYDPNLQCELGMILCRNGQPDVGVRALLKALKLDPTHKLARQALAEHFKRVGDSANAEKYRP